MKSPPVAQKAPDPKVAAGMGTTTDLFFLTLFLKHYNWPLEA